MDPYILPLGIITLEDVLEGASILFFFCYRYYDSSTPKVRAR